MLERRPMSLMPPLRRPGSTAPWPSLSTSPTAGLPSEPFNNASIRPANLPIHFCSFFAILIQSFGFSALDSLLYGTPGGAVVLIAVVLSMYLGDRFRMRILFGIIPGCIGLLGVLLIWLLPSQYKVGRLIGYYL